MPRRSQPTINQTIDFLMRTYGDLPDKGGKNPTYMHAIEVMSRLDPHVDMEVKLAALLHDIIEDTQDKTKFEKPITLAALDARGYSKRTLGLVATLTKIPGLGVYEQGMEYLDWIKALVATRDPDVIRIKYADVMENKSEARLQDVTHPVREKAEKKYQTPALLLREAMQDRSIFTDIPLGYRR